MELSIAQLNVVRNVSQFGRLMSLVCGIACILVAMLYGGEAIKHSALLALFAIPLVLIGLTLWDPIVALICPRRDLYLPYACDPGNIGLINAGLRMLTGGAAILYIILTITKMTYVDALILFSAMPLILSGVYRWDPVVALLRTRQNTQHLLTADSEELLSKAIYKQAITTTRRTQNRYSAIQSRVA